MSPLRIGIQGVRASFHEVAARRAFAGQEITPVECPSFKSLCAALDEKRADYCLMAIENSIAGSILPNYGLIEQYGFRILGETYLRIELCLMALAGQQLGDIRFVQSHPMALAQCQTFLATLPEAKVLETSDTAESAQLIREQNLLGHAAVASKLAAETYGLSLLQEGIESDKQNYTRFLVICRAESYRVSEQASKASIRFEAAHRPGSLAAVLDVFGRHAVNLTKIQSVPLLGKPYQYAFHIDLEWGDAAQYRAALAEARAQASNLLEFGEYPRAERPSA